MKNFARPLNFAHTLYVRDASYFEKHLSEISSWLDINTSRGSKGISGMTIQFENQAEMTWFVMMWDGR